ncbi:MAG TPA: hypothetical protein VJ201_06030 [Candidatus Babeliales bacterium]|nr:hypothetical protein [Candidatus Babeliales bacterium]
MNLKKTLLGFLIFITCSLVLLFYFSKSALSLAKNHSQKREFHAQAHREHWITVFIHGSFHTGLGLLSFFDVLNDRPHKTFYQKLTKKLRNDPYNYQEQIMLEPGLIEIIPSFISTSNEYKLAAYPIIAAYDEILNHTVEASKLGSYYTFGWSGLMSQTARRSEAVCLYNALTDEVKKFKTYGITPKIRLICHSHGGNVALNLGAIPCALQLIQEFSVKKDPMQRSTIEQKLKILNKTQENRNDAVSKMAIAILSSPSKIEASQYTEPLKKLFYKPIDENLEIEELIMLGTPIQPETSHFCCSYNIKKIFNLYSSEDVIQSSDWVSTKNFYSARRFEPNDICPSFKDNPQEIYQVQLMIEKDLAKYAQERKKEKEKSWYKAYLTTFLKIFNVCHTESKDPTHKDLWFLSWDKEYTQPGYPFHPLPMVIFLPLIMQAIKSVDTMYDLDINFVLQNETLTIQVAQHEQETIHHAITIPATIIQKLRTKVEAWEPKHLSREADSVKLHMALQNNS